MNFQDDARRSAESARHRVHAGNLITGLFTLADPVTGVLFEPLKTSPPGTRTLSSSGSDKPSAPLREATELRHLAVDFPVGWSVCREDHPQGHAVIGVWLSVVVTRIHRAATHS